MKGMSLVDALGRPLQSLRISLTDRCNLRCQYCMPEEEYTWLPRKSFLNFDEIEILARIFASRGVNKIRLTGGEPLLRPDISRLITRLRAIPGIVDLALTTNGVLLAEQANDLAKAGLLRLTVSLDTLKPERFFQLTRRDRHADLLRGIETAESASFS
jgi:cyclic pyranopterin phosphate synthase